MLNQHRNLVVPESDYLRVGDCVVDVPRREVDSAQGEARRITLKALQVLLVLVAHQGRVVSREALLEWVWSDTLPTDDVLTQAITQLRKAFGDDRDAPRYVETIAKGGYRLLAPVEWLAAPRRGPVVQPVSSPVPEPAPGQTTATAQIGAVPAAAPSARGPWLPLAAATLVVAVIAFAWLLPSRTSDISGETAVPMGTAPAAYQRITSLPGNEMWPSLSPDGSQVVYSAWVPEGDQAGLMVQTTAPIPARALTTPPKGVQDTMPMWSPNGREIAFERLGPGDRCGLYVMPSSGGDARLLSPCKRSELGMFSWHPDGRHLVGSGLGAVSDDDGALHVLDVASGAWTRLPYRKASSDVDLAPAYSPDGKWIAFRRNVSLSDLWRVPAEGGEPERLTNLRTNLFGLAWTPDSTGLVFGRYQDASAQLSLVDVSSRRVSDLGIEQAGFPSVAAHASSLAFVVDQTVTAMHRLDLDRPDASPEAVFPSSGMDLMPAISPDGSQIAYMSDRAGRLGLWWARLGQDDSLRLIDGLTPIPRYAPVWNADGRRLLVVGRDGVQLKLYEVYPVSGRVQRLPVPEGEPVHAAYLPGSERLLVVADQGAGRLGLTLYDRGPTTWRPLAHLDDVAMTHVDSAHQRILFTRPMSAGLWQADFDLRNVRQLSQAPDLHGGRRLALLDDGVWLGSSGPHCVLQWEPLGTRDDARRCRQPGEMGLSNVSYDRVHRRLYYSVEQTRDSDIGWMPLPAR